MNFVPRVSNFFRDSYRNLMAGLGSHKDKASFQRATLRELDFQELHDLYRGDWLARKIVDVPAFDSTRAWRRWQAKANQIEAIEAVEKTLGLRRKLFYAISRARLWGGSALVLGIDRGKFDEELDYEDIEKDDLKFVHCVGRMGLSTGDVISDVTSPWYGEPSYYYRNNIITPPSGMLKQELVTERALKNGPEQSFAIHPSRVIRLVGMEYPDIEFSPDGWGDSVLQVVHDALANAGGVASSVAAMMYEAKFDKIKVQGLTQNLQTDEGTQRLVNRFAGANVAKSVTNAVLLDATEEWDRDQLQLASYDKVMQMYLMLASGAADIPGTRLFGREPAGMNSTGESDLTNYYDRLSAEQEVKLTPTLSRLDEILLRSTFGTRDPSIFYEWNPLWQMSETEKAKIYFAKAQAYQIDVAAGLIEPVVLKKGRENQLIEDGVYPGLEAAIDDFATGLLSNEDLPDVPEPELLTEKDPHAEIGEDPGGTGGKPTATKPGKPKPKFPAGK